LAFQALFTLRVMEPSVTFFDVALPQYQRAGLWVIIAPLVLWLRLRIPLSLGAWVGGTAFHLAASAFIMVAYYLGRVVYLALLGEFPWSEFWPQAQSNFWGTNTIDMLFYWSVIAWGYWEDLRQRYRLKELRAALLETKLTQAELQVLKRQLHPHFLFNTMNTISVLVREGRNAEAVRLISKLSTLLRMSLDSDKATEVSLQQELDFLGHYVELQKARFADRLVFTAEVTAEAQKARIPNLLLQPIVENAIIHGIAPKQGPGLVALEARCKDGMLCLCVTDDGCGFVPEASREGVGLSNTRERLARIYGGRAHLDISSSPGKGTRVSIELPLSL